MAEPDRRYDKAVHDPAFGPFPMWSGTVPAGMCPEWHGVMTRAEYAGWAARDEPWRAWPTLPEISSEYPEWVALLTSLIEANERNVRSASGTSAAPTSFVMAELGAGWGRWIVNAATCIRQAGWELPYRLVGVEAEPQHYVWMRQHVRDNGLSMDGFDLCHAAIADRDGTAAFIIGRHDPDHGGTAWFGQSMPDPERADVETTIVPALSLATLLAPYARVDLLDLDIQGSEWAVLSAGRAALTKVRRVCIETHTTANEASLRGLFRDLGWACEHDYPRQQTSPTPWGDIAFDDGVQVWKNPG